MSAARAGAAAARTARSIALALALAILARSARAAISDADCVNLYGGALFGTRCYKISSTLQDWEAASAACASWAPGATLASVRSDPEQAFLATLLDPPSTRPWFGLNDRSTEGVYVWTDGSANKYFRWSANQPDNANNNEDCGEFNHLAQHATIPAWRNTWNDRPCTLAQPSACTVAVEISAQSCSDGCGVLSQDGQFCYFASNTACFSGSTALDFNAAQAQCAARRSSLYLRRVGESPFSQPASQSYRETLGTVWAGATDQDSYTSEGNVATNSVANWAAVDGSALAAATEVVWSQGQPDEFGDQDCAVESDTPPYQLSDEACASPARPYVCRAAVRATGTPRLLQPVSNTQSTVLNVAFELPEAAQAGSLRLEFAAAGVPTVSLTLVAAMHAAGSYSISNFNVDVLSQNAAVASVTPQGVASLSRSRAYSISVVYSDLDGNAEARSNVASPVFLGCLPGYHGTTCACWWESGLLNTSTPVVLDVAGSGVASAVLTLRVREPLRFERVQGAPLVSFPQGSDSAACVQFFSVSGPVEDEATCVRVWTLSAPWSTLAGNAALCGFNVRNEASGEVAYRLEMRWSTTELLLGIPRDDGSNTPVRRLQTHPLPFQVLLATSAPIGVGSGIVAYSRAVLVAAIASQSVTVAQAAGGSGTRTGTLRVLTSVQWPFEHSSPVVRAVSDAVPAGVTVASFAAVGDGKCIVTAPSTACVQYWELVFSTTTLCDLSGIYRLGFTLRCREGVFPTDCPLDVVNHPEQSVSAADLRLSTSASLCGQLVDTVVLSPSLDVFEDAARLVPKLSFLDSQTMHFRLRVSTPTASLATAEVRRVVLRPQAPLAFDRALLVGGVPDPTLVQRYELNFVSNPAPCSGGVNSPCAVDFSLKAVAGADGLAVPPGESLSVSVEVGVLVTYASLSDAGSEDAAAARLQSRELRLRLLASPRLQAARTARQLQASAELELVGPAPDPADEASASSVLPVSSVVLVWVGLTLALIVAVVALAVAIVRAQRKRAVALLPDGGLGRSSSASRLAQPAAAPGTRSQSPSSSVGSASAAKPVVASMGEADYETRSGSSSARGDARDEDGGAAAAAAGDADAAAAADEEYYADDDAYYYEYDENDENALSQMPRGYLPPVAESAHESELSVLSVAYSNAPLHADDAASVHSAESLANSPRPPMPQPAPLPQPQMRS